MYPFCKAGLLDYTLGTCGPDGDLCGSGRSIIETLAMHAGFECLDVACYTWAALTYLQEMATAMGDGALVPDLVCKADTLAARIRTAWWLPAEGLFADVRATVDEVRAMGANAPLVPTKRVVSEEGAGAQARRQAPG